MIDWVMPPQTVVALYIYRVGRSCPARNPFTTRNPQGLLNSTQTRGPPVRPVRPTGQTGVAIAGSATRHPTGQTVEGHQSDQWYQPDRPCAKFGSNRRSTPRRSVLPSLLPDDLSVMLQKINPSVVAGPARPAARKIDVSHNCSRWQRPLCPSQLATSSFRGHSPTVFSNAVATTTSARLKSRRCLRRQVDTTRTSSDWHVSNLVSMATS
jgi:hypothetical protein